MTYTFLWIGLVVAVIDWIAVAKHWKALEYPATPGVILALLAWLISVGGLHGHIAWFAIGLAFSLAGGVLLFLPKEQFTASLGAFLFAHFAYLIGFNDTPPPINLASIVIAVLVGVTALRLYRAIAAGLAASGRHSLKMPVLVYLAAISLMLISALLTLVRSEWSVTAAWLASIGSLLYFASDSTLAWNKFVHPLRYGSLGIIVTYHLGQALIALGAAAHFLSVAK